MHVDFHIKYDWIGSGHRGFLLAGYTPDDYRNVTFMERIYAFGDRSVGSYASKTARAIRSLMEGKPVGDVVEVPVMFNEQSNLPDSSLKRQMPTPRPGSPKG
jgi:hypothetical protein